MYFMVDRAMASSGTGSDGLNWSYATAAISAFVDDPGSAGLDVGLGVFPAGSDRKADCMAGKDCGAPVVALTRLPAGSQLFLNAMTAEAPPPQSALPRPTECALRGMIQYCLQHVTSSTNAEPCVGVLITQGPPSQCDMNESNLEAILADGRTKGVQTFVVGLAGADMTVLDRYAMAGGTGMAADVSSGPSAFVLALDAIRSRIAP
jgi:hypothetical protein